MWIDWVGGWASHALAAYLGGIAGLIAGAWLSWYGEDHKREDEQDGPDRKGSTTRRGDHA